MNLIILLDKVKETMAAVTSRTIQKVMIGLGQRNGTRYAICPRCGKKGYYKVCGRHEEWCRYCH